MAEPLPTTPQAIAWAPRSTAAEFADERAWDELRRTIDGIDRVVRRFLRQRAALSSQVQQMKLAAGHPHVDLSREAQIIEGYRTEFGRPGLALAEAVLSLCDGAG